MFTLDQVSFRFTLGGGVIDELKQMANLVLIIE